MKHKKKQKHLEGKNFIKTARMSRGPCNTQEDTPQRQSPVEAAACRQAAGERPDFSKGFICVFSPLKRPSLGPCNTKDDALQPKSPEETPSCSQAAREKSAFSEPFVCVFSPSKHPHIDEDAKLNSREGALQRGHKAVALTQRQKARKASSSQSISSKDQGNDAGRCITQDNVPQPEPPVEATACSQAAGEKSAFSEHLIGVSTPTKRPRRDEDEIKEMPISQDSQQTEDSSDYLHTYMPSHVLNNNEPFLSPAHGTEVRLMKIYYMRVQLKRGVAVSFHTKEGLVPLSKKIKMEEMTYLGKVHKDVPFSHMSEKKHLIAREPMLDSRAQEKSGEADRPAQPPALGGYPRAKTPEWLVALDSGFRCMACCRVFPTLEVLQEHVECGVREGFSCHVFHRAMAHRKYKERMRKKEEKKRRQRLDSRRKNIMA
ncbi:protein FAM170A-like [Eptesicus fuscus]|uniref:protein FAM170A-like n=1 Tax=Eptesicus fuscus TaxID=29078 RepID=UPI0024041D2D|nr:protein FAM170A-like [Eptesicus fuscus]